MDRRRSLLIALAAAVLLAALATLDDENAPAMQAPVAESRVLSAVASSSGTTATRFESARVVVPPPPAADPPVVRLSVSGPAFIEAGSPQELVVGVTAPRGARWVDLTVTADRDLLELRGITPGEGDSSTEATLPFDARLDPMENRLALRIETGDTLAGNEAAGVVIVRFEGVAPGSATVTVSGVAVADHTIATMPIGSATAQVVVMSGPI